MGTSAENSLTSFDLDLLLGPASSSISENTKVRDHGTKEQTFQGENVANQNTDYGYHNYNMENTGATHYGYQVQNMENELYLPDHEMVKKSDHDALQTQYNAKKQDYEALKKQYSKIGLDYAALHQDNKRNAMKALNAKTRIEQLEGEATGLRKTIQGLEEQVERLEVLNHAQRNSIAQFVSLVENLKSDAGTLKSEVQNEKVNGKAGRRMISTLKNNNHTLAEHLCLFACVIEGRSQLDKEARRLIKKYCKKSNKKSIEVESIESQSDDTGRGSSLADDGSIYSPAYSLNFSPLSTGTFIMGNAQKKTRDISSSPPPMIKTSCKSTSPIIFDKTINTPPTITSVGVCTSPICFENKTPISKTKTYDVAINTIECADMRTPVVKTKTLNTATSPVQFDVIDVMRSPVTKTKSANIATSPIEFADMICPVIMKKTESSNTTPLVSKTKMINKATSPIEFIETRIPVAKTNTLDITTSNKEFANLRESVAKTKVTSPLKISPSRIEFSEERSQISKIFETMELPETKSPVAKLKTNKNSHIETAFSNNSTNLTVETLGITRSIELTNTRSPVVETKTSIITRNNDNAEARKQKSKARTSDRPRTIECADVRDPDTKSEINNTSPVACTDASYCNRICKEDTVITSYKDIETSSTANNIFGIKEKLMEVQSQNSDSSQDDEDNDWEIKMILSKQSLDWDMLSPLSLTPEVDQQNEQIQSESDAQENKDINKELDNSNSMQNETDILLQSLYLSDESDNEIDREDCYSSHTSTGNPHHEPKESNNDIFDNLKNTNAVENLERLTIKDKIRISMFEDISEPSEISNKSNTKLTKPRGTSTKYKKLTKLQKIYKTNVPKNIMDTLPSVKKQQRPKPYSIPPKKHSLTSVSENDAKEKQLAESSAKSMHFTKQETGVEACTESAKCSFKKPPPVRISQPKINEIESQSLRECALLHTQTKIHPKSSQNSVCFSTETRSNNLCSFPTQTNTLPDSKLQTKEMQSNNSGGLSHDQTTLLPECGRKRRHHLAKETKLYNENMLPPQTSLSESDSCSRLLIEPLSQTKQLLDCGPSLSSTESIGDLKLNYASSKPPAKRIARVRKVVNENSPALSSYHTDNNTKEIITSDIINDKHSEDEAPPTKKIRTNNDMEKNEADIERTQTPCTSQAVKTKQVIEGNGIETSMITDSSAANKYESIQQRDNCSNVHKVGLPDGNIQSKSQKQASSEQTRHFADYNDMDIFATQNVTNSIEQHKNVNASIEQHKNVTASIEQHKNVTASIEQHKNVTASIEQHKNVTASIEQHKNVTASIEQHKNVTASIEQHKNVTASIEQHKDKVNEWRENLMNRMIYKYGSNAKPLKKPTYDTEVAKKIETGIAKCVKCCQNPEKYLKTLQEVVNELKIKDCEITIGGLMKFLSDPERKNEFIPESKGQKGYSFLSTPTKSVVVLIDVIESLENSGNSLWKLVLDSCEYILFTLEKGATPSFEVIESVVHLYVNICKYHGNHSKIWMFMLNAMYCLSFKAIPLIKHCLDLVPQLLPYPNTYKHPGLAPLVRCMVFLLHYYNCEDPFKKVQELRQRLRYKYYYNLQDENETTILFMLKTAISNLTENKLERRMLELSLLIVAKRRGTKWCHKNIVQKILLPIIKGETEVSHSGKRLCLSIIGEIMKPYKNEMTVHSEEVVNLLINMFEKSQPQETKEDIVRGLIQMNMKTASDRINKCLLNWNPRNLSPDFEEVLSLYIQSKPMRNWQTVHQNHSKEI